MSTVTSVDSSHSGTVRCADAVHRASGHCRDACGNDIDKGNSSQTSWLYQCMISECSASFERLIDLRMHFLDSHQSGSILCNLKKYYSLFVLIKASDK